MSKGILEKKKVFHQELYRNRFVYFKQKHFNAKSMIQREIRKKKTRTKRKRNKETNYRLQKKKNVTCS